MPTDPVGTIRGFRPLLSLQTIVGHVFASSRLSFLPSLPWAVIVSCRNLRVYPSRRPSALASQLVVPLPSPRLLSPPPGPPPPPSLPPLFLSPAIPLLRCAKTLHLRVSPSFRLCAMYCERERNGAMAASRTKKPPSPSRPPPLCPLAPAGMQYLSPDTTAGAVGEKSDAENGKRTAGATSILPFLSMRERGSKRIYTYMLAFQSQQELGRRTVNEIAPMH